MFVWTVLYNDDNQLVIFFYMRKNKKKINNNNLCKLLIVDTKMYKLIRKNKKVLLFISAFHPHLTSTSNM